MFHNICLVRLKCECIVSYRMVWMSGQYLNRLLHQLYAMGEGRNAKLANELVVSQQTASWCCGLQRAQLNSLNLVGIHCILLSIQWSRLCPAIGPR